MPKIISRAEAQARGLKRYFTGKPCKRGHTAERYVARKGCIECESEKNKAKPARPDRLLRWLENNKDRMKVYRAERQRRVADLLAVLRKEMPDLLKEFGL